MEADSVAATTSVGTLTGFAGAFEVQSVPVAVLYAAFKLRRAFTVESISLYENHQKRWSVFVIDIQ